MITLMQTLRSKLLLHILSNLMTHRPKFKEKQFNVYPRLLESWEKQISKTSLVSLLLKCLREIKNVETFIRWLVRVSCLKYPIQMLQSLSRAYILSSRAAWFTNKKMLLRSLLICSQNSSRSSQKYSSIIKDWLIKQKCLKTFSKGFKLQTTFH